MHIHLGFVDFAQFVFYLLIAGFLLRVAAVKWSNTKFGQALAFIY